MNIYRKIRHYVWRASAKCFERGAHVTRYYMYEHFRTLSGRIPCKSGRALSISHSANLLSLLDITADEIVDADYPDYNMLNLPFESGGFDFIVSDQVLEHLEGNPQQAIDECYRLLRPGGIAVHTTCFMVPIHGYPRDYWRYTPDALRLLHSNYASILDVGGWGNMRVWELRKDEVRYIKIPHARWHPLHKLATRNEPEWPIVTWIIAQK
jgi:SAM-dependent methyltransferase